MSKIIFLIDSSDKTISKEEAKADGYLKSFVFRTWFTGHPRFVSCYTLDCQGKEIMQFRDKEELRKFANLLLKEGNKTRKQVLKEQGETFFNGRLLKQLENQGGGKKEWVKVLELERKTQKFY